MCYRIGSSVSCTISRDTLVDSVDSVLVALTATPTYFGRRSALVLYKQHNEVLVSNLDGRAGLVYYCATRRCRCHRITPILTVYQIVTPSRDDHHTRRGLRVHVRHLNSTHNSPTRARNNSFWPPATPAIPNHLHIIPVYAHTWLPAAAVVLSLPRKQHQARPTDYFYTTPGMVSAAIATTPPRPRAAMVTNIYA
eukprot:287544-Prorocentrum_minimum.AAC.5